jgi:hypothetical protein
MTLDGADSQGWHGSARVVRGNEDEPGVDAALALLTSEGRPWLT